MNKKSYIAYREYGSEQTLCPNPIKPIKPYKKKISKVKRDFSLFKSFIFVVFSFSFFLAYSAYAKAEVFYSGEENDGWEILSYTDETVALTKEGDFTSYCTRQNSGHISLNIGMLYTIRTALKRRI